MNQGQQQGAMKKQVILSDFFINCGEKLLEIREKFRLNFILKKIKADYVQQPSKTINPLEDEKNKLQNAQGPEYFPFGR